MRDGYKYRVPHGINEAYEGELEDFYAWLEEQERGRYKRVCIEHVRDAVIKRNMPTEDIPSRHRNTYFEYRRWNNSLTREYWLEKWKLFKGIRVKLDAKQWELDRGERFKRIISRMNSEANARRKDEAEPDSVSGELICKKIWGDTHEGGLSNYGETFD